MTLFRARHTCAVVLLWLTAAPSFGADTIAASHPVAMVDKHPITAAAFVQQVQQGMRQRFYHGKVAPEELEKFGDEVLQQMVDRILLLQEAKRRKLKPDSKTIDAEIAGYDKQYAASERWQKERERRLPLLRANLEEQSLRKALEAQVRKVPTPGENEVRDYYKQHPDKFTTPEKVRVSLILLKVDPSSPSAVWKGALEEGAGLVEKLRKGADFASLAKLHSGDNSAEQGGDLGYIHKGMLAPELQQALEPLKPGELAEPVRVLQGVAVVRLDGRSSAKLNPFEQVAERARELQMRERGDSAWQALVEGLRKDSKVVVDRAALKTLFTRPDDSARVEKR